MARLDRDPQTWALLRCAKCSGESAQPFRATCVESELIEVDIRCPDCHHEWRLARDDGQALPPVIELPLSRLQVRKRLTSRAV